MDHLKPLPASRMTVRCRSVVLIACLACLLLAAPTNASEWRVVFGTSWVEWDTDGDPSPVTGCLDGSCNDLELENGNLEDGFGAQIALEWLFNRTSTVRWFAGAELGLVVSEYRSSQYSLGIGEVHLVGGIEANLGAVRPMVRFGGGYAMADPGGGAVATFIEPAVHIAFGEETGVRLGYRLASHGDPSSTDFTLSLVAPLDQPGLAGDWDISWSAGAALSGPLGSEDMLVRSGPYTQLGVHRESEFARGRIGLLAHVTARETEFKYLIDGVAGLDVSARVGGLSLQWDHAMKPYFGFPWRLGAGLTVADWDDKGFVLADEQGNRTRPEVELAVYFLAQIQLLDYRGVRLVGGIEPVYWPDLGLYEARARLGFEISP